MKCQILLFSERKKNDKIYLKCLPGTVAFKIIWYLEVWIYGAYVIGMWQLFGWATFAKVLPTQQKYQDTVWQLILTKFPLMARREIIVCSSITFHKHFTNGHDNKPSKPNYLVSVYDRLTDGIAKKGPYVICGPLRPWSVKAITLTNQGCPSTGITIFIDSEMVKEYPYQVVGMRGLN